MLTQLHLAYIPIRKEGKINIILISTSSLYNNDSLISAWGVFINLHLTHIYIFMISIFNSQSLFNQIRIPHMVNPFSDQKQFMKACDQTADNEMNAEQYDLYRKLIAEEVCELEDSVKNNDRVEQLDALIDILVVTIGAIHSMGADAEGAWNEVLQTNLAKIDPQTGKVTKRDDGKVLKPEGWKAPELKPFLSEFK
ncbi:MAG: hypothetical protein CMM83_06420 [Rhodospirillales bacterium]|nr:hypothetical protein [Rhodospirillales bacterium]